MRVAEIFLSVQGEGLHVGRPAVFLRLQGCNLRCTAKAEGYDCDTPYAQDPSGGVEMSVEQVFKRLEQLRWECKGTPILVVTGGEPLLQAEELERLLWKTELHKTFSSIVIETNGTVGLTPTLNQLLQAYLGMISLVVSPKKQRLPLPEHLRLASMIKFVISNESDFSFVNDLVGLHPAYRAKTCLMPACQTAEEHNKLLRVIWEYAKREGYMVSPRLHILAYGEARKGA